MEHERKRLALDDIECAISVGAAIALRNRAQRSRAIVAAGTTSPEKFPDIAIRSPEATIAARKAELYERMAAELEAETHR